MALGPRSVADEGGVELVLAGTVPTNLIGSVENAGGVSPGPTR